VLAASNRDVLKRNMSALPAYSLALGPDRAARLHGDRGRHKPIGTDGNTIVPLLFEQMFPSWFAGIAFAAIGIGALVPAAIMSIAAANLFTRNIYKEYLKKDATPPRRRGSPRSPRWWSSSARSRRSCSSTRSSPSTCS
jgi:SSS family solute:Na+ symporter